MSKYRPRNDFVLIKIVNLGETPSGIRVSDSSIEGKEFHVEAVGDQVTDLKKGDRVLMIGALGTDFWSLPGSKDLILIKQAHVVIHFPETNE